MGTLPLPWGRVCRPWARTGAAAHGARQRQASQGEAWAMHAALRTAAQGGCASPVTRQGTGLPPPPEVVPLAGARAGQEWTLGKRDVLEEPGSVGLLPGKGRPVGRDGWDRSENVVTKVRAWLPADDGASCRGQ